MKPWMWAVIFSAVTGLLNYVLYKLAAKFGNFLGRKLFKRDGGGILGVWFFIWIGLLLMTIVCMIAMVIKGFDTELFIGVIAVAALFTAMTIAAVFLSRRAKARAAADEEFEAMEDYKNHQPDLRVYVEKIIRDWDPVGLTSDAPEDTYQAEIDVIEKILKEDPESDFSLMTKIMYVFGGHKGRKLFENRIDECRSVAQRLLHAEQYRPDVEVSFSFNGTRQSPAADGYRPPHELIRGNLTSGIQHYYNKQTVEADGTAEGTINFLKPEFYPKTLWIGKEIPFYDDCKIAGTATVRLIFNPVLDRDGNG
ncbi:MAG: hypothetical protein K6A39_02980 [Clostridiales bacterium]|nr:hypothetical protein [Clostridiales bacterium]